MQAPRVAAEAPPVVAAVEVTRMGPGQPAVVVWVADSSAAQTATDRWRQRCRAPCQLTRTGGTESGPAGPFVTVKYRF